MTHLLLLFFDSPDMVLKMSVAKKRLLIVDEDLRVREATRFAFEAFFDVREAGDEKEALRLFHSLKPDVVFLEIEHGGKKIGWDLLRTMKEKREDTVILVVTRAHLEPSDPRLQTADAFFEKPVAFPALAAFLREKKMM
jgi:DNA-binding response OmpR family regulator